MPGLSFSVTEPVAKALRDRARLRKMSVSRYLAEIFTTVAGSREGQGIKRTVQPKLDEAKAVEALETLPLSEILRVGALKSPSKPAKLRRKGRKTRA